MSIFLTTPPRHAMLLLPTFHAALNPCPVSAAAFTPHEQGRYCGQCRRVVQDFTQSLHPAADLAAARAASPDGRVCGSFSRAQVTAPPPLSRRLRWFVVALVLVVGQGLTAREALAQVRKSTPTGQTTRAKHRIPVKQATAKIVEPEEMLGDVIVSGSEPMPAGSVYTYVEQMPAAPGGGGLAGIVAYIQKRVRYPICGDGPQGRRPIEGRVYVSFTVDTAGRALDARVVKGLNSMLDEEALRVVSGITDFTPGRQNGQLVPVSLTVPIIFRLE